jgi:hypothetical protein
MTLKELISAELELMSDKKLTEIYQIIQKMKQEEIKKKSDWDRLSNILDQCKMETGIPDFAEQHDHYIHGCAKRNED